MAKSLWTAGRLDRRRRLHAAIDLIAGDHPAAAARLRLALYTTTYEADTGALDDELLDLALALIGVDLAEVSTRGAPASCVASEVGDPPAAA